MIDSFDDYCLWMYVVVDDISQQISPLCQRPDPTAACSDSELLVMALVGECRSWAEETATLPRRNQQCQLPPELAHTVNAVRQIIEAVNGQLTEQFPFNSTMPIPFRVCVPACSPS